MIAYWPVLYIQAQSFDDNQYLFDNPLVKNPGWNHAVRFLMEVSAPSTVQGYYQPLTMISLMVDYARGGKSDPLMTFHQTHLALHLCNTLLIMVFLNRLFRIPITAAWVGLFFGLHPVNTEVVAWISERKTLLATFFSLTSLISYTRYAMDRSSWKYYGLSWVFYVLAILSKPTSIALPIVMMLLDYWPIGRSVKKFWIEKTPFFAVALISAAITYISQGQTAFVTDPTEQPFIRILLTISHNVAYYLMLFCWPPSMVWYYPLPAQFDLAQPMMLPGVVITLLLLAGSLISWRWTRAVVVGIAIFFIAIFPTLGVVGFTNVLAANKFLYLPSLGLLCILGRLFTFLWHHPSTTRWCRLMVAGAVMLVALGMFVQIRELLGDWKNTETLYKKMIAQSPQAALVYTNLTTTMIQQNKIDDAFQYAQKALELDPFLDLNHSNLATIYTDQKQFDLAEKHFRRAIQLGPGHHRSSAYIHNNLGLLYIKQKEWNQAIEPLETALRLRSDYPEAEINLAIVLIELNKSECAISHLQKAISFMPDNPDIYRLLMMAHWNLGSKDQALPFVEKRLKLSPDSSSAHYDAARLYAEVNQLQRAIEHYQEAIRLKPGYAAAHNNLGNLLAKQNNLEQAITHLRLAITHDPELLDAQKNLGIVLTVAGRTQEAIDHYILLLKSHPELTDAQIKLQRLQNASSSK